MALAHHLRRIPFDGVLVSPVERSRGTVAPLLAMRVVPPPLLDAPGWHEIHHGRWEGMTYQEVQAHFPYEAQARFAKGINGKPDGGESLAEGAARVLGAWNDLLYRFSGGRILVVTSATPIQLVLCNAFGLPPAVYWHWRIDLGSVTYLDVYETGVLVRNVNEVPRLMRDTRQDTR